jgi:hypothetical protein
MAYPNQPCDPPDPTSATGANAPSLTVEPPTEQQVGLFLNNLLTQPVVQQQSIAGVRYRVLFARAIENLDKDTSHEFPSGGFMLFPYRPTPARSWRGSIPWSACLRENAPRAWTLENRSRPNWGLPWTFTQPDPLIVRLKLVGDAPTPCLTACLGSTAGSCTPSISPSWIRGFTTPPTGNRPAPLPSKA